MYQICVSGAAKGESVTEGRDLARAAGAAIARAGHSLLTGATIGLPNQAAEAYKEAGGKMSVGISPATSKIEHVMKYRLPTEAYDTILFTGLHYVGRDSLLIASADAVISIGGRLGTLHEFTISMEMDTPIGILTGAGGTSTEIDDVMRAAGIMKSRNAFFSDDPEKILQTLVDELDRRYKPYARLYK